MELRLSGGGVQSFQFSELQFGMIGDRTHEALELASAAEKYLA